MTEQCFTTSYDSRKDQDDASDIKARTVVMTFSGALLGGMFPLDPLTIGSIDRGCASVRRDRSWLLTLESCVARRTGHMSVGGSAAPDGTPAGQGTKRSRTGGIPETAGAHGGLRPGALVSFTSS